MCVDMSVMNQTFLTLKAAQLKKLPNRYAENLAEICMINDDFYLLT